MFSMLSPRPVRQPQPYQLITQISLMQSLSNFPQKWMQIVPDANLPRFIIGKNMEEFSRHLM